MGLIEGAVDFVREGGIPGHVHVDKRGNVELNLYEANVLGVKIEDQPVWNLNKLLFTDRD